jgi:hypothetical protein
MRRGSFSFAVVALGAAALAGCGSGGGAALGAPSTPPAAASTVAAVDSSDASSSVLVPLPEPPGGPRTRARVTSLGNGAALVTGGLSSAGALDQVLYYDPTRARFFELAPLGHARFGHEATLLPGASSVLVTGGYDGQSLLDSVELIRLVPSSSPDVPIASQTLELPALPTPRSDHRALLVPLGRGSRGVLLLGGFVPVEGGAPAATSVALVYRVESDASGNAVTGCSVQISQPRVARSDHAAVLLPGPDGMLGTDDDRVLVFGGVGFDPLAGASDGSASLATLASPEVYEPVLDRWSQVHAKGLTVPPPVARPRRGHRATAVAGGGALVLGGVDAGRDGIREGLSIELDPQDPGAATFSTGAVLARARRDAELARLEDGTIVLAGGVDPASGQVLTDAEVVAADGRALESPASLGGSRVHHSLAALGARLLVLGGTGDGATFGTPTAALLLLGH